MAIITASADIGGNVPAEGVASVPLGETTDPASEPTAAPVAEPAGPPEPAAAPPLVEDDDDDREREPVDGETRTPRKMSRRDRQIAYQRTVLQQQAEELEAWRTGAVQRPPAPEPDRRTFPEPTAETRPEQGEDEPLEDYLERMVDWKAEQKVREEFTAREQVFREQHAQRAEQARVAAVEQSIATARVAHRDFDAVVFDHEAPVQVTEAVAYALERSGRTGELMYHLAMHPEDAEDLNAAQNWGDLRERLGVVKWKMAHSAGSPNGTASRAPQTTRAPNPLAPVTPSADGAPFDPRTMSAALTGDEWRRFSKWVDDSRAAR